jgi:hypothetical protein
MRCCIIPIAAKPPEEATPDGNNSLYCFNFLTQGASPTSRPLRRKMKSRPP